MNAAIAKTDPGINAGDTSSGILKIAIMAVGGQGGGVLAGWVADLAVAAGYHVQATSVAGVAQRTGATIYYVEIAPRSTGLPVFALSPTDSDVDILIASELMEAARAVTRGFITPDKTFLIASSHRVLAVSEKLVPGDGRSDGRPILEVLNEAAKSSLIFDMETIAKENGSVISAALFGALAKSETLPFGQDQFEVVIVKSGRGVEASLAAFRAAVSFTPAASIAKNPRGDANVVGPPKQLAKWQELETRIADLPDASRDMVLAGLKKTVSYQDIEYGQEYLDHLDAFTRFGDSDLTRAAAKSLANLMCYDDIIRVADIKSSPQRQSKLRRDQQVGTDPVLQTIEYFHPRAEEVFSILPRRLGNWCANNNGAKKVIGFFTSKGRRIRSDRFGGFLVIWLLARLRRFRRRLLRHGVEMEFLFTIKKLALDRAKENPELAVEILQCQRLIKGYSETHARGHSKFDRVVGALPLIEDRPDAADWVRRLREAALLDENGSALDGAIQTIETFTEPKGITG